MGALGSGKTSMQSLSCAFSSHPCQLNAGGEAYISFHSSNNPALLTLSLGVTIDIEQNHVRFYGDLNLNLWDCGGQDMFVGLYLSTQ